MRIRYLLLPLTLALLSLTSGCHKHNLCCCGCMSPCSSPCGCGYTPPLEGPVPPLAVPTPLAAPHAPILGLR